MSTFSEFKHEAHQGKTEKMQGDRLYCLERNFSVRISYILVRLFPRIHPNSVSIFSLLVLVAVFWLSFFAWSSVSILVSVGVVQLLLLYCLTITDKVDGEIARVAHKESQRGLYYDRAVHFLFPLVFYFTIGHFFLMLGGSLFVFYLTLALGALTQKQIFFREARLLVKDKLQKGATFTDTNNQKTKGKRLLLPLRVLDYLTFMALCVDIVSLYRYFHTDVFCAACCLLDLHYAPILVSCGCSC